MDVLFLYHVYSHMIYAYIRIGQDIVWRPYCEYICIIIYIYMGICVDCSPQYTPKQLYLLSLISLLRKQSQITSDMTPVVHPGVYVGPMLDHLVYMGFHANLWEGKKNLHKKKNDFL